MSLSICGLGLCPKEDATLESLQVLESCRLVYTDIDAGETFRWLASYCRELRSPEDALEIVGKARSADEVGLAVWGHPQYSSRLAREVQTLCRRKKIPYRRYAANSPIGNVLAGSVTFFGGSEGYKGVQAYELAAFLGDPPRKKALPLVVFYESLSKDLHKKLLTSLLRMYPAGHKVTLHDAAGRRQTVPLGDLAWKAPCASALYVPPMSEEDE